MTTAYIIWSILLILTFIGIPNVILSIFSEQFEEKESYIWMIIVVATMWIRYFLAFNTY